MVSGLTAGTTYYFAIKAADEVPNWATISNVPSGTTLPPPDTTPPAAIANLAITTTTQTSATVSWTAPGDDGSTGTATSYDLRYSTAAITAANFASATAATGEPAPTAAGTTQSVVVSGLTAGTTYYFAIKAADEVPNWATISNVPSGTTLPPPDTTPPAAIANLAITTTTQTSATVSWTAPGDDGSTGTATSYDLRYSTGAITAANWASATAATGEPAPTAAGRPVQFMVSRPVRPEPRTTLRSRPADEVPNWTTPSPTCPSGTTAPVSRGM